MIDKLRQEYAKDIATDGYVELEDLWHCHSCYTIFEEPKRIYDQYDHRMRDACPNCESIDIQECEVTIYPDDIDIRHRGWRYWERPE